MKIDVYNRVQTKYKRLSLFSNPKSEKGGWRHAPDIKQFQRNIKQFHCSIKEIEITTMEFHRSIQKAPFCPPCGVSCVTYPIHVLTCKYTT